MRRVGDGFGLIVLQIPYSRHRLLLSELTFTFQAHLPRKSTALSTTLS